MINDFVKLLFILICLSLTLISCSTKHIDRIGTIQRAFNYSNIDSTIVVCYTEDIIFDLGDIRLSGKEALRGGAEWDSVINSRFYFSDFRISGDTVFCKCTEENDISKLQGIEKGYFDPVIFVFENDKIKYTKWEMTQQSKDNNRIAYSTVIEWASLKEPQQLDDLMPGGNFIMNAVTANGWLALTKAWLEDNE